MNITDKIYKLMDERGWTTYVLAEKAGLTQSTISSLFSMKITPKLTTLEKICNAFGISLSEFFSDEVKEDELKELIHKFNRLSDKRKEITKAIIDEFQEK